MMESLKKLTEDDVRMLTGRALRVAIAQAEELNPLIDSEAQVYYLVQAERILRNDAVNNGKERWWNA